MVVDLNRASAFQHLRAPTAIRRAAASPVAPTMVIDKMTQAAENLKGAAIETVVAQKVEDKLAKAREKYEIPDKYMGILSSLFTNYMTEVYKAGKDVDKYESVLTEFFTQVLESMQDPYKFEPYHKAIREPYDYYELGKEFMSGVIDIEDSIVSGESKIAEMQKYVEAGDNVVLLANHQSEADPQIFSVLLDPKVPGFSESVTFVAGDRVTTDLLAQPFSKGRNLLCIFSKKHVENPPEQKAEKTKHNRNVMRQMQKLFNEGGKIIWVAPSGGRDRKGPDGKFQVSDFDAKSVEMFRLVGRKSGRRTHFYPLSMLTGNVAPPPDAVGGAVGEARKVNFSPAGLYFGDELDPDANIKEKFIDYRDRNEQREAFSQYVHGIVEENYKRLEAQLDGQS